MGGRGDKHWGTRVREDHQGGSIEVMEWNTFFHLKKSLLLQSIFHFLSQLWEHTVKNKKKQSSGCACRAYKEDFTMRGTTYSSYPGIP